MAEAAEGLVLLNFWASPFGMRVRIALGEKGISYEYREEDLSNKSALLLESNPIYKKIPVLIHASKPICESLNIVHYIEDTWPEKAPLFPSDPFLRSQARFWGDYIDKTIHKAGVNILKTKGEEKEEATKVFLGHLRDVERELGDKDFFLGDSFGYVDIALVSFASLFPSFESGAGFSVEEECPKLMSWVKRCMARESVAKTLQDPQKVQDFVNSIIKKLYGVA